MKTTTNSAISVFSMIAITLMLTTPGCIRDSENIKPSWRITGGINHLDIANARSLVIAGGDGETKSGASLQSDEPGISLFKITDDGEFEEIKYYRIDTLYIETDEGTVFGLDSVDISDIVQPVALFNISAGYMIACFEQQKEGDPHNPYQYNYMVRKSDGAAFDLPGRRPTFAEQSWSHGRMYSNEYGSHLIQADSEGNIYYIGNWVIYKLDIRDPGNITREQLTVETLPGEDASNFRVNGQGHIIFNSGGMSTPESASFRFNSGTLQNPEKTLSPYWVGFDDNFYTSQEPDYTDNDPGYPVIERINLENEDPVYEQIGIIDHPDAGYTSLKGSYMFRIKNHNKIIALAFNDDNEQQVDVVAEVYNDEMEVKSFGMAHLGVSEISFGASSANYYYLAGRDDFQPVLVRVDPSVFPHRAEYLVPKGELDIFSMVVSADDVVTFHALSMSGGGSIVIGEISPGGMITIHEKTGTEPMQLIRLQ
jgi:hypothetical protein